MKLYEINDIYTNVMNLDLPEEELNPILENIQGELTDKAENIAKLIQNLKSDVDAYKAEEARLKERRQATERRIESIKNYLQNSMITTDNRKFKAGVFSFNIQKNPPSLKIEDENKVPDEFIVLERKVDKTSLKKAIQEGLEVDGITLEQTESLRIR